MEVIVKNILFAAVFAVISFNSGALFADDQAADLNSAEMVPQQAQPKVVEETVPTAFTPTTGTYGLSETVAVAQQELSQEATPVNSLLDNANIVAQELSEQAVVYFNAALEYLQSAQAYVTQLYNSWE
jgi:hypothetical protein